MNTKARWSVLTILSAWVFAGCVNTTEVRYQISEPATAGARVASEDRESVRDAVGAVASELKLKDFTASSLVPETIVYFQQENSRTPLKIIAFADGSTIFVDLIQVPGGAGETLLYRRARDLLNAELRSRFGPRTGLVSIRELQNNAPVQH